MYYLVGGDFSGFFVDGEFRSLLIRLLDNRIFHLSVDAFIFVGRVYLQLKTDVVKTILYAVAYLMRGRDMEDESPLPMVFFFF